MANVKIFAEGGRASLGWDLHSKRGGRPPFKVEDLPFRACAHKIERSWPLAVNKGSCAQPLDQGLE